MDPVSLRVAGLVGQHMLYVRWSVVRENSTRLRWEVVVEANKCLIDFQGVWETLLVSRANC